MGKEYRCPECNGTEIIWDRGIGKAVCPKDRTPLNNYKIKTHPPSSRKFGN